MWRCVWALSGSWGDRRGRTTKKKRKIQSSANSFRTHSCNAWLPQHNVFINADVPGWIVGSEAKVQIWISRAVRPENIDNNNCSRGTCSIWGRPPPVAGPRVATGAVAVIWCYRAVWFLLIFYSLFFIRGGFFETANLKKTLENNVFTRSHVNEISLYTDVLRMKMI